MNGGDANDKLYGGSGQDYLKGGSWNDILDGGADNDKLIGVSGTDTLTGGACRDVFNGGDCNDTLTGGVGADVFVMSNGRDTITDFRIEDGDKIFVKDISQLLILQIGSDVFLTTATGIDLMAGDTMVIQDATQLDVSRSIMDSDSYIGLPWGGTWNFNLVS